jgi:hypothetical protein
MRLSSSKGEWQCVQLCNLQPCISYNKSELFGRWLSLLIYDWQASNSLKQGRIVVGKQAEPKCEPFFAGRTGCKVATVKPHISVLNFSKT